MGTSAADKVLSARVAIRAPSFKYDLLHSVEAQISVNFGPLCQVQPARRAIGPAVSSHSNLLAPVIMSGACAHPAKAERCQPTDNCSRARYQSTVALRPFSRVTVGLNAHSRSIFEQSIA